MRKEIDEFAIHRLACHQIHRLIQKNKSVEELKAEWFRRWGMEYPYWKSAKGIGKIE